MRHEITEQEAQAIRKAREVDAAAELERRRKFEAEELERWLSAQESRYGGKGEV